MTGNRRQSACLFSTPVLGGSMRIGNWLGGSVIWALVAVLGVAAAARSRRASHDGSPRWFTGWINPVTITYGVYVPTRFGGELTIKTTVGQGRRAQGAQRSGADQRPGRRPRPAGMVHLPGRGRREALHGRDQVRSGRAEHEEALELLLLADQGRLDSRALGGGQRAGRHGLLDAAGTIELIRTPGSYIPPGEDIVRAGPNGLLETLPRRG